MLFDSHCHLNFSAFKDNYREIIADFLKKGIGVVNIGSQFDTSCQAVAIANEYPDQPVYASIGLHPIHISGTEADEEEIKFKGREPARTCRITFSTGGEVFDEKKYQELIDGDENHKIVAIGEIGLDYFHEPINSQPARTTDVVQSGEQPTINNNLDWKELQKQGLIEQIIFAAKNNLPIILHARGSKENPNDAYLDMLEVLLGRDAIYGVSKNRDAINRVSTRAYNGVLHCYGADREIAQKFLDLSFYLGFTGIITFKNKSVAELQEVVKSTPLDRILVETDAPYLSPEPHRGEKNTPQNVEFVARKIAELKGVSFEEVCQKITKNFYKIFIRQI